MKEYIWNSSSFTRLSKYYRKEAVDRLREDTGVRNSKNEEMIIWASKCLAWKSLVSIMGGVSGVALWILLQPVNLI